jgi:flagellar protein FliL
MDETTAADPKAAAPPAPPKRRSLLIMLLAGNVVVLGGLGVAAVLVLKRIPAIPSAAAATPPASAPAKEPEGGHAAAEGHAAAAPEPASQSATGTGPTLRLADFVVRLRNSEADRFARISFEIEVTSDKDKEVITARQAQIRDSFIAWLSDRNAEELRGSEGLTRAKTELLARAVELAKDGHVRQLYITDFVVQ